MKPKSFAVLYTCFNRKEKTLSSLKSIYSAYEEVDFGWSMQIYLTDDGCTDGTAEAVVDNYPEVKILKGNGSLYWAGGMRNSWNKAKEFDYDAYLLLNDDTQVNPQLFNKIIETNKFCQDKTGNPGIYVGATIDPNTGEQTYGGSNFTNRFFGTGKRLDIKDVPQKCEMGNANIMWVPKKVVDKIGILAKGYTHGMADYDYTMTAVKKGIPVYTMPNIAGTCENDHGNIYERFITLDFIKRLKFLHNPVGLDFKSQIYHMKKHFPARLPLFIAMGYFKVVFPKLYYKRFYASRV